MRPVASVTVSSVSFLLSFFPMRRDFSYINDASFISAFTHYYFTLLSLDIIVLRSESIVSRFYSSLKNLNSNDQILALISCGVPPSESLKADNDTWIAINSTSSVPCSQFKYRRMIVWCEPRFSKPIITRKRLTMAGRNRVLFNDQWSSRNVVFVDRFSRSGASEAKEIHQACNDRGSSAGTMRHSFAISNDRALGVRQIAQSVARYPIGSNELDEKFVRRSCRGRFVREPMQMIVFVSNRTGEW